MKIKIINKSNNPLPNYSTIGSSGMDLRAFIDKDIILKPLERQLIPTGLFIAIPEGYEVQIRPRSGLSIKHGITLINCVGTIDSDYRGELQIPIVNLSNKEYKISSGDRICQMVLQKYEKISFDEVEVLDETDRNDGGFGHTGY
ncbi:dUTP diphosphatase [uncultured Finegoldia sp.]|uniref:dUTP diphosphatase n=1 Tax=uncultured Finegoldia sp. TaxID=328009 RepID=UPI00263493AA|nr:dUTP diphosphatase [uncultured Finegoldia sp.]